jgi:hypothetical protein
MRFRSRSVLLLAALATLQAGCGGEGSTENSNARMTAQESAAVYGAISLAVAQAFSNVTYGTPPAHAPSTTSSTFSGPVNASGACSAGGTTSITGLYSGNLNAGTGGSYSYNFNYTFTLAFNNCKFPSGTETITLQGNPNLILTGNFNGISNRTSQSYHYEYDQNGGVRFGISDGRSGNCSIDYTVTADYNGTATTGSASGTICGITISIQF